MIITSLENNKIKEYLKLKQKKYRDETRLFLAPGIHLVLEALKENKLVDLLVSKDLDLEIDFPSTLVSSNILKKLSEMNSSPKVIGIVKMNEIKNITGNRVVILDDLQDPGNLGTIIRSSVAFNVTDIVLSNNTVDLYNEKVIRASQGMIFKINIIRDDITSVIKNLKNKNYLVLGTNVNNGVDVSSINPTKYAIVIGNEGLGVKDDILALCDKNIYIKMNNECESLNAAVALSIIIYELSR